jgi:hypothetical protein
VKTSIVYGDRWLEVDLPDRTREADAGVFARMEPADSLEAAVDAALAAPLGSPRLAERARGAKKVTIAFDDPTVPCFAPLWEVAIARVFEELRQAGVAPEQVRLLCANAMHRKFTRAELAGILGPRLVAEHGDRLFCHDAESPEELIHLGKSPSGYDVELNRAVVDSDLVIYVNASSFRGFNGGWKSICVGLSTWRSIRWHHTPEHMTMSVDRSPMHEILGQMGAVVEDRVGRERFFKIETLLANPVQVGKVWAGTIGDTRRAVLEAVRASTPPRRELLADKADIVVYGVPDWSPYAAYSFMNPLLTLLSTGLGYLGGVISALGKPGCSVVLATPCPDRWDEVHHPSYREVWDRILPASGGDPHVALEFADEIGQRADYLEAYRHGFGFHPIHPIMGLFPLSRLRHAPRVYVAGAEAPELARHAGLIPAGTVEEAVAEAERDHGGSRASIALVRYPPALSRQLAGA